jgi:hypothetical protein
MTKGELIKALEPFSDEIEVLKVLPDRDGNFVNEQPITRLTYSYVNGVGQIILE